jgi:hypothetical protein
MASSCDTFAVAALRLLSSKKIEIFRLNIFLTVGFRAIKCIILNRKSYPRNLKMLSPFGL